MTPARTVLLVGGDGAPVPEGVERILEQNQRSVEWDDPRLPPLMLQRIWWDQRAEGLVWAIAATYRLQGPEGAWSGTGQGFATLDLETYVLDWHEQMVLAGEGAYDGLTALLTREDDYLEEVGTTYRYEGIIFEGDPPPFLEPFVAGEYGFEYPTEPLGD